MIDYIFWILVIAYSGHIMEEYFLNWKVWVFKLSSIEVSWTDFYITNSAVVITGICMAMIGPKNLYISMMFPALMLINALFFHLIPTIFRKMFSPGVITSVIFFIPLSALTYFEVYRLKQLDTTLLIASFSGGLLLMLFPVSLIAARKKLFSGNSEL